MFEVGSPKWLEMLGHELHAVVGEAAAAGQVDGVRFSMCEVYTGVPARVAAGGRAAWHFRLADGEVTFAPEEADGVDLKVVADWDTIVPLTRVPFVDGTPETAAAEQAMTAAVRSGAMRFVGDPTARPAALLAEVHNRVARHTA